MIPSLDELNELDDFFKAIKLPQTLTVKGGKYQDLPKFISDNLDNLKTGVMAPVVARARYADLIDIKKVLQGRTYNKNPGRNAGNITLKP